MSTAKNNPVPTLQVVGWRLPTFTDFISGEPGQATVEFYEKLGATIEYAYAKPQGDLIESLQARIAELEAQLLESKPAKGKPSLALTGEVLGPNAPAYPDWCTTFETRAAYQQGVADCRVFDAKQKGAEQSLAAPLTGRWHHGHGVLCSGSLRIASWDCDTNPSGEFKNELLDWICQSLNSAIEVEMSLRARMVDSEDAYTER